MKRIGMGIVGAGFVGPHHIDAVRRLGYVDVVAVAGSSQVSADKKAEALGARKAYGSYEALLNDPSDDGADYLALAAALRDGDPEAAAAAARPILERPLGVLT